MVTTAKIFEWVVTVFSLATAKVRIENTMFTAALLTIANTWKQTQCPSTDNWMCEYKYTHTMDYYSPIEKSETLPFAATQLDQERLMLIK